MMRSHSLLPIIALFALSACASAPISEYMDNDTAATITIASGSFVFARERTDLAIHAQDYITITPVQVNRSGQRTVYLYCQLWSTIDRRFDKEIVPSQSQLALIANDRRVDLPTTATDIRPLGFGHWPIENPTKSTEIRVVAIDAEFLRFIVDATERRIALTSDGLTNYFLPWRENRKRLQEFLARIAARN